LSPVVKAKRRLFIDPASISSGWAIFEGKTYVKSGTIAVDKRLDVYARLSLLSSLYYNFVVDGSLDEIHIEQLPRRCHIYTHYSVGVIGTSLSRKCSVIKGDIPVKSWQAATGWEARKKGWADVNCTSEDELAAICMGEYWVGKYGG
jgi:Holliday junction resolvasome RuvABC endonuclease subunit